MARIGSWTRRVALLALVVGLAQHLSATAAPSAGAPARDVLPLETTETAADWFQPPSGDDIAREYPKLAQWMLLGGEAVVTCTVEIDGHLDSCRIVKDTPPGLGFGAAAVRATASWRMKPATRDGRPVPGLVTIPLRFQLAPQAVPPRPPPMPNAPPASLALARRIASLEDWRSRGIKAAQPMLDAMASQVVAGPHPEDALKAVDALHQGMEDAMAAEIDRRVHDWAATVPEGDLKAIVNFYESPPGRAWLAAQARSDASVSSLAVGGQIAIDARAHFCAQVSCPGVAQASEAGRDGQH